MKRFIVRPQVQQIYTHTERVLIVDDNPDHTTLARVSLERHGWLNIDSAATLEAAFDTIRQHRYELVLIDYCLPDGFGLDLIEWIRNDSAVVVMTGMGSEEIAAESIKSGAIDYLIKNSIFPDVLPDVASRAVERFRSRTQSETRFESNKRTLKVTTTTSESKHIRTKNQNTESRLIQMISRISSPLTKALADGSTASPVTQVKRLKTALANCDEVVELIKQTSKHSHSRQS